MASGPAEPFARKVLDENWTAKIIVKGAKSTKIANGNGYFDDGPVDLESGTTTVEVTARSLEALQRKIMGHVGLLEDDMLEA